MKVKKLTLYGLLIAGFATIANADNGTTYDKISITPQAWEEIDLTYINTIQGKDYTEQANLLRPINWIKQHHLDAIGATAHLTKDEIGADVNAKVIAIKPINLNYANNVPGNNKPVIGTFVKHSDDVWDYTFKDQNGLTEKIAATSNHPFYSLDRLDYVPIGQIEIGEHLKVNSGKDIVLDSKLKHNKVVETVYNLEIYQAHNYAVGNSHLLVHNGPCKELIKQIGKAQKLYKKGRPEDSLEEYLEVIKHSRFKVTAGLFTPEYIASTHWDIALLENELATKYINLADPDKSLEYMTNAITHMKQAEKLYILPADKSQAQNLLNSYRDQIPIIRGNQTKIPELGAPFANIGEEKIEYLERTEQYGNRISKIFSNSNTGIQEIFPKPREDELP